MGGYKIGTDRKQLSLLPVCLDDYISESHICRVINAFTEQLDLFALDLNMPNTKTKAAGLTIRA